MGDAHPMLNLSAWHHPLLRVWQADRPAIIAALVALAVLVLGRLLRLPRLQAIAPGLALAAGWSVALGGVTVAPRAPADRLPMLALAGLAAGVAAGLWRWSWLVAVLLAAAAGWWLAGAPRTEAAAAMVLPHMACMALAVLLAAWLLGASPNPWVVPAAALALWGALTAGPAPQPWPGLALVLVAATLGQVFGGQASGGGRAFGRPASDARMGWTVRLTMASGLAGLGALAVLASGRLPRGGVGRIELAALAPLVAMWLAPRLMLRLPWGGGVLAASLAAAVAVVLAWGAGRLGLVR